MDRPAIGVVIVLRQWVCPLVIGLLGSISTAAEVEFLTSVESKSLDLPFSEATRVGNTIFLSGQIGNRSCRFRVDLQVQLRRESCCPQHSDRVLSVAGLRVSKCTVFLADIADWPAVNEVYRQFFGPDYPARSAVAGSGLALGARVEIECIAVTLDSDS